MKIKVAGKWLTLSFEGAYTRFDYDDDGLPELFADWGGIYMPLAGKTVTFTKANEDGPNKSNLGVLFDGDTVTGGRFGQSHRLRSSSSPMPAATHPSP